MHLINDNYHPWRILVPGFFRYFGMEILQGRRDKVLVDIASIL